MRVKIESVVRSLKKHAKWCAGLGPDAPYSKPIAEKYEDIVVGCLDLMDYAVPSDKLDRWIDHKPRRACLRKLKMTIWSQQGRRAVQELIKLTISELEACALFRPEVEPGVLPVRKTRTINSQQRESLAKGREIANEKRTVQAEKYSRRVTEQFQSVSSGQVS